jgi:hypothetical protein
VDETPPTALETCCTNAGVIITGALNAKKKGEIQNKWEDSESQTLHPSPGIADVLDAVRDGNSHLGRHKEGAFHAEMKKIAFLQVNYSVFTFFSLTNGLSILVKRKKFSFVNDVEEVVMLVCVEGEGFPRIEKHAPNGLVDIGINHCGTHLVILITRFVQFAARWGITLTKKFDQELPYSYFIDKIF